jgi:ABC-2 type transport system permease protein
MSILPIERVGCAYLKPLRYYLTVIRGTFLKGVGLSMLCPQLLATATFAACLLAISVLRFRESLE